jgi:phage shock protein E
MHNLKNWFRKTSPHHISKDAYDQIIKDQTPHTLIDVRREEEYKEEHIKGAKLLPLHYIEAHVERLYPNKKHIYILYCRSGIRSHAALKLMLSLGYQKVYDLGGIINGAYETINNV